MNSRERIKITLAHKEADRVPISEWVWELTEERWHKEGIPENISVEDFFEFEMLVIYPDITPQFSLEILKETEDRVLSKNSFGETIMEFKDHRCTPQTVDSPVKSRRDWEELKEKLTINDSRLVSLKGFLNPRPDDVFNWEQTLENVEKKGYQKGKFVLPFYVTGFDLIQRYLGMERLLIVMATEPEWAKEMFLTHAKFIIELHEFLVENGFKCDGVFCANDMGYRNASFFSPRCYKELILPSDKLMCDYFHSKNLPVIFHSDGNILELLPDIIEAGFDCINPVEVGAQMDLVYLKQKYGDKIAFWGGIDTKIYSLNDPIMLEDEIKTKFEIAKKGGGYIYGCDQNSIPPTVSLSQYKKVIELVRKYGKY